MVSSNSSQLTIPIRDHLKKYLFIQFKYIHVFWFFVQIINNKHISWNFSYVCILWKLYILYIIDGALLVGVAHSLRLCITSPPPLRPSARPRPSAKHLQPWHPYARHPAEAIQIEESQFRHAKVHFFFLLLQKLIIL